MLCLAFLVSVVVTAEAGVSPIGDAVVVALDADAELYERVSRVADWQTAIGMNVLWPEDMQRKLTGIPEPELADLDELQRKLSEADDREVRYNTEGANELRRQILDAYGRAVITGPEIRVLTAQALHALAAAHLFDGKKQEAVDVARTALRRFSNVPLDTRRYPSAVEALFKRAAVELKRLPTTEVTISVSQPADIFADGQQIGMRTTRVTKKLPQGNYVISAVDDFGKSFAHPVVAGSTPIALDIDVALEGAISWSPFPTLRCVPVCDEALRGLARRLDAKVVGLRLDDQPTRSVRGLFVNADGMQSETRVISALADVHPVGIGVAASPPSSRFSPWSLVPFGVGQFEQRRYVAGSIYAGIQTGLLAWHVIALVRHGDHANSATDDEESTRAQRNVSGILLIGAMIANVAEALVFDATQ